MHETLPAQWFVSVHLPRTTRLTYLPTTFKAFYYTHHSVLIIQLKLFKTMSPKPAPKLTKKQIQELKKQQGRKREEQERKRKEEEEVRLKERMRVDEIDREKRTEEERIRIVLEKEKYREANNSRLREENEAVDKLREEKEWSQLTGELHKSYNTSGPKLSTFINVFREEVYESPQKTLKACEQSQKYVGDVREKLLSCRAQGLLAEEEYYKQSIWQMRRLSMQKIERIMIEMANSAEDMQQKNNEISKKGEPNRKVEGQKILEYQHFISKNIKIGMFLNSNTTKNLNKFRPIEIKEFGLNTEIPSKWMNSNTIVKFQWINFNPFSPQTHEKFLHVGGVYNLEFYELFLGSKKINNIVLKKFYKGSEILEKFKMPTAIIKEPFNVMYQIPKYVFLSTFDQGSLRFGQYDFVSGKWCALPHDTLIQYDQKEKKAICRLYRPEPIAYIQDRCTDYPYVSWQLRSVEAGKAHFDIQFKRYLLKKEGSQQPQRFIIKFQIDNTAVRAFTTQPYPELADLAEKTWTPELILHELSERGVHLLPTDDDYEQAKVPRKDRQAETNAIRDIAYAIQSFYIRSQINDSSDIIVKIRENLEYESVFLEDQEKDWKKIRWSYPDRCEVTNRKILDRHLNLEVLLQSHDFCLKECLERIKYDKNYLFKKNIMKMLSLTRVLSFTTNKSEQSNLRWLLKEKVIVKA